MVVKDFGEVIEERDTAFAAAANPNRDAADQRLKSAAIKEAQPRKSTTPRPSLARGVGLAPGAPSPELWFENPELQTQRDPAPGLAAITEPDTTRLDDSVHQTRERVC